MEREYYIVINGEKAGPFVLEELKYHNLKPETYVWRAGMDKWMPASTMPELSEIFVKLESQETCMEAPEIPQAACTPEPAVHTRKASDLWNEARKPACAPDPAPQACDAPLNRPATACPPPASPYSPYQGGMEQRRFEEHTNWLPWAIVATVLGLFTNCLTLIFGIIGIVKANNANQMFEMGRNEEGRQANSSARTFTVISLVLFGASVIFFIILLAGGFFAGVMEAIDEV